MEADKHGFIKVNGRLETTVNRHLCAGRHQRRSGVHPHFCTDDFRIIRTNLIEKREARAPTGRLVPYTVFIDPQLGRVGMTETEARTQKLETFA